MKKTLLLIGLLLMILGNQKIYGQERYIDDIFTEVDIAYDVVYGNNVTVFPTLLGQAPSTQDLIMDIYGNIGFIYSLLIFAFFSLFIGIIRSFIRK